MENETLIEYRDRHVAYLETIKPVTSYLATIHDLKVAIANLKVAQGGKIHDLLREARFIADWSLKEGDWPNHPTAEESNRIFLELNPLQKEGKPVD